MNDFKIKIGVTTDVDKTKIQSEINKQATNIKLNADFNLNLDKKTLDSQISTYLKNNIKLSSDFKAKLTDIQKGLVDVDKTGLRSLRKEFTSLKAEATALGKSGKTVFQSFMGDIGNFATFLTAGGVIMSGINLIRNMISYVKELDKALISLKKVTDETDSTYNKFLQTATRSAKELGSSISNIVEMTATWAKLGYTIKEASELAKVSTIYANVADINNTETAVSDLVTAMKSYGIEAKDAIRIADRFNEIGNKYATDAASLGEGLKNAASSLSLAGNSIDESLAMLTAMTEITQNASESGNALKILGMRLRGMKGELEALGEESDGIESISKIQTQILNLTSGKVNIFDDLDPTKFKSTYDIMLGISKEWSKMGEVDQAQLLEIIAGKQRGNSIAALIQGMSQAEKVLETSLNSSGSALKEQQSYMEGIQYSADRLKASFQELSSNTLNSDWVKIFYDLANGLVNATDKVGLFNIAILATVGILNAKKGFIAVKWIDTLITKLGVATSSATGLRFAMSAVIPAALIIGGIAAITKAYDHFVVTLDEQKEKLEAANTEYQNSQKEISDINTELETTAKRIDELLKKDNLTFVEQSELEKLQEVTKELRIQQDIAKDSAARAAKTLADENKKTYNAVIGNKSVDYYTDQDIDKRYSSSYKANNINQAMAYKKIMEDALLFGNFDGVNIDTNKIFNRDYLKKNIDEYVKIIEEGIVQINDFRKPLLDLQNDGYISADQIKELEYLTDLLETLYIQAGKELDWNNIQFESAYNSKDFQNQKEELEALSKAGKLDPSVIASNEKYKQLLDETGLSAEEVVNQIKAITSEQAKSSWSGASSLAFTDEQLKSIDKYESKINILKKAYNDISNIDIKDLIKEFPEYNWTQDAIDGTKDLKTVLNELISQSLNEAMKAVPELSDDFKLLSGSIFDSSSEIRSLSDALSNLQSNSSVLYEVSEELKKSSELSPDSLSKIIKAYPQLTAEVAKYNSGLITSNELFSKLEAAYNGDLVAYTNATRLKLEADEEFSNTILSNQDSKIDDLAKAYGLDFKNWKTIEQAKFEAEKKLIADLSSIWLKYYKVTKDSITGKYTTTSTLKNYDDSDMAGGAGDTTLAKIDDEIKAYNTLLDELNNYTVNLDTNLDWTKLGSGKDKKENLTDFSNSIDWIAKKFDAMKSNVDKLNDAFSHTDGIEAQKDALSDLIAEQEKLSKAYENGTLKYDTYYSDSLSKLKKLGFSDKDIKSVRKNIEEGSFSIEDFIDKKIKSGDKGLRQKVFDVLNESIGYYNDYTSASKNKVQLDYDIADNNEKLNEFTRQIQMKPIEVKIKLTQDTDNELDLMNTLLGDVTVYDEFGKLTENGAAKLAILNTQLRNATDLSSAYKEQIELLNDQFLQGLISQEDYDEQLSDINSNYMNSIKSISSFKNSILELARDGINAETEAYKSQISNLKEVLAKKRELEKSNKSLEEKQKRLAVLQKQINALSLDDNRKNTADRTKLEEEYAKLKEDLDEEIADNSYNETVDSLDKQQSEFEKAQDKKLSELKNSLSAQEIAIQSSLDSVSTSYENSFKNLVDIAKSYGIQISDNLTNPLKNAFGSMDSTNTYSSVSNVLTKNTTGKSQTADTKLNQYLIDKGYNKLSWDGMAELASSLGLKASADEIRNSGSLRMQILELLKNAGFANGGKIVKDNSISSAIKMNGDNTLISARVGEGMLNENQTNIFEKFVGHLNLADSLIRTNSKFPNYEMINKKESPVFHIDKLLNVEGDIRDTTTADQVVNLIKSNVPNIINEKIMKNKR